MEQQSKEEILSFLKNSIEPLENSFYGAGYRASAYLVDGTFLPCVIFRSPTKLVELAIKRFDDETSGRSVFKDFSNGYHEIVKHFISKGNRINDYDIVSVERSKFALPCSILRQIKGETTMGWTGFAAKMKDGEHFGFGTTFLMDFFQMPDNYSGEDIEEIVNHSYVLKTGELRTFQVPFFTPPDDYNDAVIFRERPYFECYIDNL